MGSTPLCEINDVNHGVSSRGAAGDVWPAIGRVTGTEPADLFHLFHARFVLDVLLSHVLEIVVNGFQTCWVSCCVVLFRFVCCSFVVVVSLCSMLELCTMACCQFVQLFARTVLKAFSIS